MRKQIKYTPSKHNGPTLSPEERQKLILDKIQRWRLQWLNEHTGDPFTNYNMIVVKWVKDRKEAEKTVHHVLKFKSEEHKGEWFKLNEHVAKEIVESLVL